MSNAANIAKGCLSEETQNTKPNVPSIIEGSSASSEIVLRSPGSLDAQDNTHLHLSRTHAIIPAGPIYQISYTQNTE